MKPDPHLKYAPYEISVRFQNGMKAKRYCMVCDLALNPVIAKDISYIL